MLTTTIQEKMRQLTKNAADQHKRQLLTPGIDDIWLNLNEGANLNVINHTLERFYSQVHIRREKVFARSKCDPKEADPDFKLLTEALETINDCIEIVMDAPKI